MRRIALLGAVVLGVGFAHGALAADWPVVAQPVYRAPVAVMPNWTGLYLGVHAGWGWVSSDEGHFAFKGPFTTLEPRPTLQDFSSPLIGGQFGYNMQTGNWVFGAEVDGDGANMRVERYVTVPGGLFAPFPGGSFRFDEKQTWLASLKGRIGYTFGTSMIYASFGTAWTGIDIEGSATFLGTPPLAASFHDSIIKRGTVFGAGYEWMIGPNWAVRGEMLFYNFSGAVITSNTYASQSTTVGNASGKLNDMVVRVGLDYKFDYIGAPATTRY
jgi:outer membrane immunogenic protein